MGHRRESQQPLIDLLVAELVIGRVYQIARRATNSVRERAAWMIQRLRGDVNGRVEAVWLSSGFKRHDTTRTDEATIGAK